MISFEQPLKTTSNELRISTILAKIRNLGLDIITGDLAEVPNFG